MAVSIKSIDSRIQHKHDLEVNWNKAKNFVPLAGELIIYDKEVDASGNTLTYTENGVKKPLLPDGTDPDFPARDIPFKYARVKIGDGVSAVSNLPFIVDAKFNDIITCGTSEPDLNTIGQFYFKYNA